VLVFDVVEFSVGTVAVVFCSVLVDGSPRSISLLINNAISIFPSI